MTSMPPEDVFDYISLGPITEDGCAFRLIRLFGGDDPTIECELFKARMGEDGAGIPYDALSYVWGSSETTEHIIVNDKSYLVTSNLLLALQNLRREDEDRIIWIDAICIDQYSNREKNHQILLMTSIYKSAEKVIFWLGPSTYEIDILLSALKRLQVQSNKVACKDWAVTDNRWPELWASIVPDSHLYPEYSLAYRLALKSLLERAWFRRVWILQECAHAKRAEITCGKKYVSARIFALAPALLDVHPESHCQAVLDIMPGSPRDGWWRQQKDLFTLLRKFHDSEASNPRDKIYALLSMATDVKEKSFPAIDYGLSLKEVLGRTLSFLFPCQFKGSSIASNYEMFSAFVMDLDILNNQEIILAAKEGQLSKFSGLMTRTGVNPLFEDSDGNTALAEAARYGHLEAVKFLLTIEGINVNARDKQQRTPLMKAVQNNHYDIVKPLLDAPSIKLNQKDMEGSTALAQAAACGHIEVVKLLLTQRNTQMSFMMNMALVKAARHGQIEIVKLLLNQKHIDVNARDEELQTPLVQAIRHGHTEIAQILLGVPAFDCSPPDYHERTTIDPMLLALQTKQSTIVRILLKKRSSHVSYMKRLNKIELALFSIEMNDADLLFCLLNSTNFDEVMGVSSFDSTDQPPTIDSRYALLPKLLDGSTTHDWNRCDRNGEHIILWAIRRKQYELASGLVEIPGMQLASRDLAWLKGYILERSEREEKDSWGLQRMRSLKIQLGRFLEKE